MAKNNTQIHVLFDLLKAAGDTGLSKPQIAKALGIKEGSVPVYFHWLKKLFKAEVNTKKQGRQIVSYSLINVDKIVIPQPKRNKAQKITKPIKITKLSKSSKKTEKVVTDEVPTLDADMKITNIGDNEFNDIKASLGLL